MSRALRVDVDSILFAMLSIGYFEKAQGGRDRLWKLASDAELMRQKLRQKVNEMKLFWR